MLHRRPLLTAAVATTTTLSPQKKALRHSREVIAIDFKLENNAAAFLYEASTKSFVIQNGPKTLMMDFFLILPLCQGHDNF